KSRFILRFTDGTGFFITLWWFGYVHLVLQGEKHGMTDALGPDPLQLSHQAFIDLLDGRKGGIKPFLLNQKRIRGIGNFYIQEILYRARLHPLREIPSLAEEEKTNLHRVIIDVFHESIALDSSSYELDFLGMKGRYGVDRMSIAYQEGVVCPACRSRIEKIRTGSTAQYMCPHCQK
ncbi:MAG: Fpg/Nei family DNA glycosylase, partial [bacterium]